MKNQERVWKAEQADAAEKRKLHELQQEIKSERSREELKKIGQTSGILAADNDKRLEWMYKGPENSLNREEYLTGRAIDKRFEQQNDAEKQKEKSLVGVTVPKNHVEHECIPFSIRSFRGAPVVSIFKLHSIINKSCSKTLIFDLQSEEQVDMQRKIMDDPLMLIRQREMEKRKKLLENPVKLKEIHRLLRGDKDLEIGSASRKRSKHEKKSKKSKSDRKLASDDSDVDLDSLLVKKYKEIKSDFGDKFKDGEKNSLDKLLNEKYKKLSSELDKMKNLNKSSKKSKKSTKETKRDRSASSDNSGRDERKNKRDRKRSPEEDGRRSRDRRFVQENTSRNRNANRDRSLSRSRDTKRIYNNTRRPTPDKYRSHRVERPKIRPRSRSIDRNRHRRSRSGSQNRNKPPNKPRPRSKDRRSRSRSPYRARSRSVNRIRETHTPSPRGKKNTKNRSKSRTPSKTRKYSSNSNAVRDRKRSRSNSRSKKVPAASGVVRTKSNSVSKEKEMPNSRPIYTVAKPPTRSTSLSSTSSSSSSSDSSSSSPTDESEAEVKRRLAVSRSFGLVTADGKKIELKGTHEKKHERKSPSHTSVSDKISTSYVAPLKKTLTDEEKAQRLREMQENVKWAVEERTKNFRRNQEEAKREAEQQAADKFDKNYMHKELHKAFHNQDSVEARIKSKVNTIQRSSHSMNSNFTKR